MKYYIQIKDYISNSFKTITSDTLEWIGIITLLSSTVPSILAVLSGIADKLPNLEIVLFVWAALMLFFIRSVLLKNQLNTLTIGIGFIIQSVLLSLIFFT
jgi:hypothetical protein